MSISIHVLMQREGKTISEVAKYPPTHANVVRKKKNRNPLKLTLLFSSLANCALAMPCLAQAQVVLTANTTKGWMAPYKKIPLNQMVLPGTHDSAAYENPENNHYVSTDEPSWLRASPYANSNSAAVWGYAQNYNILSQLNLGYRFLDLRVCGTDGVDGFPGTPTDPAYLCHGIYQLSIPTLLNQLYTFLSSPEAVDEVVVINFGGNFSMNAYTHQWVVNQLKNHPVARYFAPPGSASTAGGGIGSASNLSPNSPVEDFTSQHTNLIVIYEDNLSQTLNSNILWNSYAKWSPWPNKNTYSGLLSYLTQTTYGLYDISKGIGSGAQANQAISQNQMFVHQAQETPSNNDIASDVLGGLGHYTLVYQRHLADWMESPEGKATVGNGGIIVQDYVNNNYTNLADYAQRRNEILHNHDWHTFSALIHGNITVGRNANGTLEAFARGLDDRLWHSWQPDTFKNDWNNWQPLGGDELTGDPVVALNRMGQLEIFARRKSDNTVIHRWQNFLGNTGWTEWTALGWRANSDLSVIFNEYNDLEIFATSTDNVFTHQWQTYAGPTGWSSPIQLGSQLNTTGSKPAVALAANGRVQVVTVGLDGSFYTIKKHVDGSWSSWENLGGYVSADKNPTMALDGNGHLQLFVRGQDNNLWHIAQTAANGAWTGWELLNGGTSLRSNVVAVAGGDQRVQVFASGDGDQVYNRTHGTDLQSWSDWTPMGGSSGGHTPFVITNSDKRLEIFTTNSANVPSHRWQPMPGSRWN